MSPEMPVVIYVGGYSRSGSTLLDLVLADAFGAFGAGEVTRLLEDWDTVPCSCGEPFTSCPFWGDLSLDRLTDRRRAQAAVERRRVVGTPRRASRGDLALNSDTTRRVFAHIRGRSGASVVVDSSKSARGAARRAQALSDAALDVRFVHLLRSPYAVAASYRQTGSNRAVEGNAREHRGRVARAVVGWSMANDRAARDAGSGRWPAVRVAYEDLVRDPDAVVGRIAAALDLGAPGGPVPDRFDDARGHAVAGNRMRRGDEVVFTRRVVPIVPAGFSRRDQLTVRAVLGAARTDHGYSLDTGGVVPTSPRLDASTEPTAPRVAHVCTRFGTGGSERRIVDAMAATPELSHRVYVGPESDWERAARDLGGADVRVVTALNHRTFTPAGDLRALRSLRASLSGWAPGVVHTVQSKAGMVGRLAAPSAARRVHSVSALNFGPAYPKAVSVVARRVEMALARRTDRYLVAGHRLWDSYEAAGIGRRSNSSIVRASVPLDVATEARGLSRAEARRRLGLQPQGPIVAFVGRFEESKGVRHLPRIHGLLGDRVPGITLVLAGTGPLLDTVLASLTRGTSHAGEVRYFGVVDNVPVVLRAADCVLVPSPTEGLPQVLVQAAVTGTPFVAFDQVGSAELVELGAQGSIIASGSVEDFASEVVRWLQARDGDNGSVGFDDEQWRVASIDDAWCDALAVR